MLHHINRIHTLFNRYVYNVVTWDRLLLSNSENDFFRLIIILKYKTSSDDDLISYSNNLIKSSTSNKS